MNNYKEEEYNNVFIKLKILITFLITMSKSYIVE